MNHEDSEARTHHVGTHTSAGFIPHKNFSINGVSFSAPVMLESKLRYKTDERGVRQSYRGTVMAEGLPVPMRWADGSLMYASPGGGSLR